MGREIEEIKKAKENWQKKLGSAVNLTQKDRLAPPLLAPSDLDVDYLTDMGFPGEYPFTRGIYPAMYYGRLWNWITQSGYATPVETNKRMKYLLKEGSIALSVTFDMPTILGYDSDHPIAYGEVGKYGQVIDTVEDMRVLLDGIPIEKIHFAMLASHAGAPVIFATYIAVAQERNFPLDKLRGTIQNHFLGFYSDIPKCCVYPPRGALRIVTDTIRFCTEFMPNFTPINIQAHCAREAGANVVMELAYCLARGMAYVEATINAGLEVDRFAPKLAFYFSAHNNFFEEIAKYRIARRMWARIMRERFGARNPRSWTMRFHVQESACTATAQQPLNNIVRGTIQNLAAVIGGCQSLQVTPYDEALAIPTEESNRLALRTQQIVAYESGVTEPIDPLGGSYVVEYLTDKLGKEAQEILDKIESMGKGSMLEGVLRGIETGYFVKEISAASYKLQKEIESGEMIVVGLNNFTTDEEARINITRVDPIFEQKQIERLKQIKAERDPWKVEMEIANVKKAIRENENLIPVLVNAVKEYVTLGEICSVFRETLGVWEPKGVMK
jgi:methylmalonyl-CoA mutase N-terminal domain/subunit